MIFTSNLSVTDPLNGYNNNVVLFKPTDQVKVIKNAVISVNSVSYELTPDTSGVFRFNFLKLAKTVTNTNNFKDTILFNLTTATNYNDATLYSEIAVTYTINFTDATSETANYTYKFKKSVQQLIRKQTTFNSLLFPLIANVTLKSELTYFEGYPFDIPVFSDIDRDITINNKNTNQSTILSVLKGVNRICISDGISNVSLKNILPLYLGINELEFKIGATVIFTIMLTKVDAACGVFVKYFNQTGAYSYWLFKQNSDNILKSKTKAIVSSDSENLENTFGNFFITGKNGEKTIKTETRILEAYERDQLEDIYISPRVEMLNADRFTDVALSDWLVVKVLDGRVSDKTKYSKQKLPITIQLPNIYTQTL